jgi:hypothetical protein
VCALRGAVPERKACLVSISSMTQLEFWESQSAYERHLELLEEQRWGHPWPADDDWPEDDYPPTAE